VDLSEVEISMAIFTSSILIRLYIFSATGFPNNKFKFENFKGIYKFIFQFENWVLIMGIRKKLLNCFVQKLNQKLILLKQDFEK